MMMMMSRSTHSPLEQSLEKRLISRQVRELPFGDWDALTAHIGLKIALAHLNISKQGVIMH